MPLTPPTFIPNIPVTESINNAEIIIKGIPASAGVAHGRALVYLQKQLDVPCRDIALSQVEAEVERLDQAILQTRAEITEIRHKVADSLGEGEASIFDAHLMVLEDNALIEEVVSAVRTSLTNVESCYNNVAQRYISFFSSMEDEYLRERVSDIRDVSRRLLHNLIGMQKVNLGHLASDSIIVAEDITPSDTADMDRNRLLGFLTDAGGKTSHSVIMARSLRVPAVVGLHNATQQIKTGDHLLLDGHDGIVVINPSPERLFKYGKLAKDRLKLGEIYSSVIHQPSQTQDGSDFALMANIEGVCDMKDFSQTGAEGVGLFRTEGVFLRHHGYPDEPTQYEEYATVVRAAGDTPVIIRTLDIGGDKTLGAESVEDDDSFMGFRAIRFCLENPEIFKTQLRAILRASAQGQVKVMYPMISGLTELRRANELLEAAKCELRARGQDFDENIEVGTMVEIPSAATIVDLLAQETDFLSIGTNDLIQYMMAVDRLNDRVAHLYDPAHPAVIRTLKAIIDGARSANVPVSVCGEMAGEPIFAALLIGMGANSLSLAPSLLPEVKFLLRNLKMTEAQDLVQSVLANDSSAQSLQMLEDFRLKHLGDLI
jgi:phosphoenolpyruvate-protein phosphotransferase (PTS system enzyme I)